MFGTGISSEAKATSSRGTWVWNMVVQTLALRKYAMSAKFLIVLSWNFPEYQCLKVNSFSSIVDSRESQSMLGSFSMSIGGLSA